MSAALLVAGGSIFALLGLLHALYTLADSRHPRRLAPDDPNVLLAMSASTVRLSRGATTMWRAWLGFNFSHSLGALMFGAACVGIGLHLTLLGLPRPALLLPAVIGGIYLWLAVRYWFRIPAIGIALATLCFAAAWISY
jgi:hypothetical protein